MLSRVNILWRTCQCLLLYECFPQHILCQEFSGVLKTLDLQFIRLAIYQKGTPLESAFWIFLEIFEMSLRYLARSLFSVVLQPVDCKFTTLVKREFLKISRGATFQNLPMHLVCERIVGRKSFSCSFPIKLFYYRRSWEVCCSQKHNFYVAKK